VEVVTSLSQGRTGAAQGGLFTHKSVPVIFEPPCTFLSVLLYIVTRTHNFYWQFLITLTLMMGSLYISAVLIIDTADCLRIQVAEL
jgi:hypothetical protein